MATKETIEGLVDRYNLNSEVAKYEDSKIGYMFHDRREFHPLYFLKKDDQLECFIDNFFEEFVIRPDKLVGFSISINRITDNFHGIIYQLEKEFNKDNIKKMLDDIFPKPDQIFESMQHDTIQDLTDKMLIEGMMNVAGRKTIERHM